MRRKIRPAVITLLAMLIFISFPLRPHGKNHENDLTTRSIINLHLTNTTLVRALGNLSVYYGVPVGLEIADEDKDEPTFNLDVDKAALKDVLDLITRQNDNYRWEVRDGVINFTPMRSRDTFLE